MIIGFVGEWSGPETGDTRFRCANTATATARFHTSTEQCGGLPEKRGHLHRRSGLRRLRRAENVHRTPARTLHVGQHLPCKNPTTTSPFKNSPNSVIGSTNVSEKSIACYRPVFLLKPCSGARCRCLRRPSASLLSLTPGVAVFTLALSIKTLRN